MLRNVMGERDLAWRAIPLKCGCALDCDVTDHNVTVVTRPVKAGSTDDKVVFRYNCITEKKPLKLVSEVQRLNLGIRQ